MVAACVAPRNGGAAGEHLEEHHAHRVEIGAAVDALAARRLGRHVARVAERHAGGGVVLHLSRELRDAEVDQLDELGIAAAAHEHDVAGAYVAVHDAVGVRGGERVAQLRGDARGARGRQARAAIERAAQIVAGEVLHDVGDALFARLEDEVVDLDEVLACRARRRRALRRRSATSPLRRGRGAARELDGGGAAEPLVAAEVDLRARRCRRAGAPGDSRRRGPGEVADDRLCTHGTASVQRACHGQGCGRARRGMSGEGPGLPPLGYVDRIALTA